MLSLLAAAPARAQDAVAGAGAHRVRGRRRVARSRRADRTGDRGRAVRPGRSGAHRPVAAPRSCSPTARRSTSTNSPSVDLLSPTLLRVTAGRVLLTVAGAEQSFRRRPLSDRHAGRLRRHRRPRRIPSRAAHGPAGPETELAVLRGFAALVDRTTAAIDVRAGERTLRARPGLADAPAGLQLGQVRRVRSLGRGAPARSDAHHGLHAVPAGRSADVRQHVRSQRRRGSHEPSYGYVWYPSVAFDWRPYYNGYWSSIRPYGWTWIGLDVWSWPTHHYGRWGHARNRWFWIPERRWAAAWVSWGAAPGYVSWCPLGFDNRPVFGLTVVGEPWAGWVVVPRTHFGGYRVNQWAVAPHRLHRNMPFATLASSPVPATARYAVPRSTGRRGAGAGRFAVPRNAPASDRRPARQPRCRRSPQPARVQQSTPGDSRRVRRGRRDSG